MTTLRPYQIASVEAVREAYREGRRSALLVLPTGCGKTVVFAEAIRRTVGRGRRALVLAHRAELLEQAHAKLVACGVAAHIEQACRRAPADAACVVASVQTLRGARLERWPVDAFDLVVIDEAHHALAAGYQTVLARFACARILGVTATPDRLDGRGLVEVFETCAYRYEMRQAIRDGWLSKLRARRVAVVGLDLASIHTRSGDLDAKELGAVMAEESALHGVAVPLLELSGDRPTIVFAVDVAGAHALCEVLNRYQPNVARAVDGTMSAADRSATLAAFRVGMFRVLVNCALFTEGFDEPSIACVAIARPTKSRGLYTQMVGRGTRLHPGKADCLVLDFVGNSGRHRLVGPAEVLAGRELDDETRELMESVLTSESDLESSLDSMETEVLNLRARAKVLAVARYRADAVDPFLGALPPEVTAQWGHEPASDAQRDALNRAGLLKLPPELSRGEASRWLEAIAKRRSAGLASIKQVRALRRYDVDAREMAFSDAADAIKRIAAGGWKKRRAA